MSDAKATPIDPTLQDLLKLAGQAYGQQLGDVPAKVETYNAATQTINCQPLVLLPTVHGLKPAPIVQQVQVRWPAGATWSIVGDLVKGDFGWLRPAGADISGWKMSAIEQDPTAIHRSQTLSDAVFEPGSQPISVPLAADAYKAGALVIKAAELLLGSSSATKTVALNFDNCPATGPAATPSTMQYWMAQVETALNALAVGSVFPLSAAFATTAIATITATATKVKAI